MIGIFLSHSHKDNKFTKRLAADLQNNGIKVWHDLAEMKIGDSLISKIYSAIDDMQYLAVILSRASVASEWVKKEVAIAMESEIRGKKVKVLPLLIENCEIPPFLRDKLYADFRDRKNYKKVLNNLIDRIKLDESQKYGANLLLENSVLDWRNHRILIDWERLKILANSELVLTELESEVIAESIFDVIKRNHFNFDYAIDKEITPYPEVEEAFELMYTIRDMIAKFNRNNKYKVSSRIISKFSEEFGETDYTTIRIREGIFGK
jgi:hypothetical protein